MQLNLSELRPPQVYGLMSLTIIPRPIAWVLSDSGEDRLNLAPFSYFSPVCSDPPLVSLSVGWKDETTPKDTRVNIEERDDFVIHIAHSGLLEAVNESSATLPLDDPEVKRLGLATVPFEGSRLPRLKDARIALACTQYDIRELGPKKQSLILGHVHQIYVDDALISEEGGRFNVDAAGLDPIARLGRAQYAALGDIIDLPRPV